MLIPVTGLGFGVTIIYVRVKQGKLKSYTERALLFLMLDVVRKRNTLTDPWFLHLGMFAYIVNNDEYFQLIQP